MPFWFRFRMVSLFALILLYYKLIPPQILFWCKYRHGHLRLLFFLCLLWLAMEVWKQQQGQRPFFVFFLVWSSLVCRGHSEEGGHNQWCTDSPVTAVRYTQCIQICVMIHENVAVDCTMSRLEQTGITERLPRHEPGTARCFKPPLLS